MRALSHNGLAGRRSSGAAAGSGFFGYRCDVYEAPRFSGLAPQPPVPVFTARFALDEIIGARFVPHQTVAPGLTSKQAEKCVAGLFVAGFEGHDRAAPRNTRYRSLAATDSNTRLRFESLRQEIYVLEHFSRPSRNADVAVENRDQVNNSPLFITRPRCNKGIGVTISVDPVQERQLKVRRIHQATDRLSDISQCTVRTKVETHFEQRASGNQKASARRRSADVLNVITIPVNRVFNVDGNSELLHQLLRSLIDRPRTEGRQGRHVAGPQHTGELLGLSGEHS
jgi:hypothetical protein